MHFNIDLLLEAASDGKLRNRSFGSGTSLRFFLYVTESQCDVQPFRQTGEINPLHKKTTNNPIKVQIFSSAIYQQLLSIYLLLSPSFFKMHCPNFNPGSNHCWTEEQTEFNHKIHLIGYSTWWLALSPHWKKVSSLTSWSIQGLFVWNLHVVSMSEWALSGFCSSLTQSKTC